MRHAECNQYGHAWYGTVGHYYCRTCGLTYEQYYLLEPANKPKCSHKIIDYNDFTDRYQCRKCNAYADVTITQDLEEG